MGPCPHHSIARLAFVPQIITHPQAQLMRTNNYCQHHLTVFLSEEWKIAAGLGLGDLRHPSKADRPSVSGLFCNLPQALCGDSHLASRGEAGPLGRQRCPREGPRSSLFASQTSSSPDIWLIYPHTSVLLPSRASMTPLCTPLAGAGRGRSQGCRAVTSK